MAAGQTYHVRAVAENPDGIVDGPDLTFTTVPPPVPVPAPVPVPPPSPPPAPAAATQPATAIGASVATLHAVVHTGGAAASVTFQYGTSPALTGARSSPAQTVSATTAQAQVSATVSGLASGRTYYFRAVATSMPGAVRAVGPVARFTTLKRITAKVTFASAVSSQSAAKVMGRVVPQAPVGATVTVLCAGKGTGCPYAKRTMLVRAPKARCTAGKCPPKKFPSTVSLDLTGPFRNRALPFGATMTVRMTQAGFVGEAYVFTMARRVHPASGCLARGHAPVCDLLSPARAVLGRCRLGQRWAAPAPTHAGSKATLSESGNGPSHARRPADPGARRRLDCVSSPLMIAGICAS